MAQRSYCVKSILGYGPSYIVCSLERILITYLRDILRSIIRTNLNAEPVPVPRHLIQAAHINLFDGGVDQDPKQLHKLLAHIINPSLALFRQLTCSEG